MFDVCRQRRTAVGGYRSLIRLPVLQPPTLEVLFALVWCASTSTVQPELAGRLAVRLVVFAHIASIVVAIRTGQRTPTLAIS